MTDQPVLIAPLPQHRIDEAALFARLERELPDFQGPASLRQFQGGQSNPTYLIETPSKRFVLRKKPPGVLLPSAHQVEREFRILNALRDTAVPVPPARVLCEDASLIGTAFYVMDHVDGRVFNDTALKGEPAQERRPIWAELARTLAALHGVDYRAVGLGDFGRPEGFAARQIALWSRQYAAAKTDEIPAMDALAAWLSDHVPAEEEFSIAHGDFRLGNMMYAHGAPRIVAVLDWELATLGHPLSDLAHAAASFHLAAEAALPGMAGLDLAALGLPTEAEFIETYRLAAGRADIPHWNFFLALALFRLGGITQGVYARALAGNAADAKAIGMGAFARAVADAGWRIAQRGDGL